MRVALIGSVSSSYTVLRGFIDGGVDVACVLGVAPEHSRRIGGYRDLAPLAESAGIPHLGFEKVDTPEVRVFLREHAPDQIWVIGLSQLVPDDVLDIAPEPGVGFHPTMLPEGRGRAPVAWTILRNARSAVNLFHLVEEPDAGDIIVQREVPVLPDDYSHALIERQNRVLYETILEIAPRIRAGELDATPQDHSKATVWKKRTPRDGDIDWRDSEDWIHRLVRAAGRPYPGAYSFAPDGTRIKFWRARRPGSGARVRDGLFQPGEVLSMAGDLLVACGSHGEGRLWLTEVEVVAGDGDDAPALRDVLQVGDVLCRPSLR